MADDPRIQRAAEVLMRDYEDERPASHLTWRDFADLARRVLDAADGRERAVRRPVLRAGRSLGRTLYEVTGDDWKAHQCIGMGDTREWADRIVAAVNAAEGGE